MNLCGCGCVAVSEKRETEKGETERRGKAASSNVHVEQYRLPDALNFWNNAFEVECLGEDNLEDLLDVDRVQCRAEDERGVHSLREALCLGEQRVCPQSAREGRSRFS